MVLASERIEPCGGQELLLVSLDFLAWAILQLWASWKLFKVRKNLGHRTDAIASEQEALRIKASSREQAKHITADGNSFSSPSTCNQNKTAKALRVNFKSVSILKNFAHLGDKRLVEEGEHNPFDTLERTAAACRIQAAARGRLSRKETESFRSFRALNSNAAAESERSTQEPAGYCRPAHSEKIMQPMPRASRLACTQILLPAMPPPVLPASTTPPLSTTRTLHNSNS